MVPLGGGLPLLPLVVVVVVAPEKNIAVLGTVTGKGVVGCGCLAVVVVGDGGGCH